MTTSQIKLFPDQDANERILMVIRRHWSAYIIFWLIAVAMSLPVLTSLVVVPLNLSQIPDNVLSLLLLLGSAYVLVILAVLLYGFIDFYLDIYIITDRRIVDIKQNGLFNRTIAEFNLHQVQDVKASVQGFLPTMLHYGEVLIQTAGEMENFDLKDVHHPYRVSKLIMDLHENLVNVGSIALEEDLEDSGVKDDKIIANSQEKPKKTHGLALPAAAFATNRQASDFPKDEKKPANIYIPPKEETEIAENSSGSVELKEGESIKL